MIHREAEENQATHGAYGATLFDPRWKARRKSILDRDQNSCVNCRSTQALQVHHRQYHFSRTLNCYSNPWEYPDNLLITLCHYCHSKGHRLYQVPTKYIH